MYHGRPIIGIIGGIGSGKSFIADLFGEFGGLVIKSDDAVHDALEDPAVQAQLRNWWGDEVFKTPAEVDRAAIARKIFDSPAERQRLEHLLHPIVAEARDREMAARADDLQVVAFIWDTPLLVETGLHRQCDAVVFVDAPFEQRLARVQKTRHWTAEELRRRENSQLPLDMKRKIAHDVIHNTADAADARRQVRNVLSRIVAQSAVQGGRNNGPIAGSEHP